MSDAKKFLFDTNDFNDAQAAAENIYSEEQVRLAREQSFAEGRADGVRETRAQQEEQMILLLEKTLTGVNALAAAEDARDIVSTVQAVKAALQVVRNVLPKLAAQTGLAEIENMILQSIDARKDEPRIAVTVPSFHLEALKTRIDKLAIERGYGGRVILLGDDALPPADCRVEWADGGAERIYERIFAQIENEFARALAGMDEHLQRKQ